MTDNIQNKLTPKEAKDIFARQRRQFELTEEEEEALAEKMGLNDINFSGKYVIELNDPYNLLNEMSLEECAALNDDRDYYEDEVFGGFTKSQIAAYCLEQIYKHLEAGFDSILNINEKLLCFAEDDDLKNAITCMGLQLAEHNQQNGEAGYNNQPGTTGKMLHFYHNVASIVTDWRNMDADEQKTLAAEAHLIEDESYIVEGMAYIYHDILQRLEKAENYMPHNPENMFRPRLSEIAADVVKIHYEYIYSAYNEIYEQMNDFTCKLLDDKIHLDNNGKYNPNMSVFRNAKSKAFLNPDYALPGDDRRAFEYEEPKAVTKEAEDKNESAPVQNIAYGNGGKKQTKARKLAQKRAAKYEKADDKTVPETAEESIASDKSSGKTEEKFDNDVTDNYRKFFADKKYSNSDKKRSSMAYSCSSYIIDEAYGEDSYMDYTEKLMELDTEKEYTETLISNADIYYSANKKGVFHGYLKKALDEAKKYKSRFRKEPGVMDTPLLFRLGFLVAVAVSVVALFIPISFIQSVLSGLFKIILVVAGLFLLITTGPGVVLFLPIAYFTVMTVYNIIGTFINPIWIIKLLIIVIPAAIAVSLFNDITYELKGLKRDYECISSTKTLWLPQAEKFLAICKERNFPEEMVIYYERLIAEFKKL